MVSWMLNRPDRVIRGLSRLLPFILLLALLASLLPQVSLAANSLENTPTPTTVTIPGTIQSKLGCSGDWQPECEKTFLIYDEEDGIWENAWDVPAGSYEYKVALDKSWTENYGLKALRDGPNIPLELASAEKVKFYYDHNTHWVTDSHNSVIATAVGTFQSEVGCAKDNDPTCMRSWMQDPDADGVYTWTTTAIPAGTYEVKVAINESMDENYGDGGVKDGKPVSFTVKADQDEIYFGYSAETHAVTVSTEGAPQGNIVAAQAHWLTRDTILWNVVGSPKYTYQLYYDPEGQLKLEGKGITGGQSIRLNYTVGGPGADVMARNPHLAGYSTFKLSPEDVAKVPDMLKSQLAIIAINPEGKAVDATSLQIPGAIDDLYTYDGPLGITYDGDTPTLRLWAPTAKDVKLHLFEDGKTDQNTVFAMALDPKTGVWTATGTPDWTNKYYLYEVTVWVRLSRKVITHLVTDPYSFSLSTNSQRSQIVNLEDASLLPQSWEAMQKPALAAPEDAVIYELHIRDFSVDDQTVSPEHRGTYLAFTDQDSNGMKHLKALALAGLTHIHLLPAFDIASVNEDKSTWQSVDRSKLASLPADSDEQQKAAMQVIDKDGFNWGYDPYHYTTPEGSYATNPEGAARILEFRQMVQGLNTAGLRVVMDVVYNHTNASGEDAKSVLDKVVPGYYHRLNAKGNVETSTCCQNTASEHAMMEKLMIDSLVVWAKEYKVDGFRFDLMGHHMVDNMANIRKALDALTLEKDGVDGKNIYLYGEGWDFGEVAKNAHGKNASQLNMGGLGIGTFNDRLRDGARGGNPFDPISWQGFLTGLYVTPNGSDQGAPEAQKAKLLETTDWIKLGLAGNLVKFVFASYRGEVVSGDQVRYNGSQAGYSFDPQETINYVSAHDNETLYDVIALKMPADAPLADRIRMNMMGVDLVMLAQGVPFFHAGDEILRSKDMDRNSYNSGDWFNHLDFTYETNNWGVGLPPSGDNKSNWPAMQALLANPALKPQKADILASLAHFEEMLQIRKSSSLFRLPTAEDVITRLAFLNNGPDQVPGLIVLSLKDVEADRRDPLYSQIVVLFNANPKDISFIDESFKGAAYKLHPVQAKSSDPLVQKAAFAADTGTFTVPARTTAVFVVESPAQQAQPTIVLATQPAATLAAAEPPAAPTVQAGAAWLPWAVILLGLIGLAAAFTISNKAAK